MYESGTCKETSAASLMLHATRTWVMMQAVTTPHRRSQTAMRYEIKVDKAGCNMSHNYMNKKLDLINVA
jgi:hypothetical protein